MHTPLCLAIALVSSALGPASQEFAHRGYKDYAALTKSLKNLAKHHRDACALASAGTSRQGRTIWALRLGRGKDQDQRTAMALVAGMDGDFPAGSAVALRIAERLLSAGPDEAGHKLLGGHTVYILPRVNPDAIESFFATPQYEQRQALRPVDDDRDGQVDEDGPEDLNGDGKISMMRVNMNGRRTGDLQAAYVPDPKEPRLLKKADRSKGERPIYALLVEGMDNDGDELWNEDGLGGVDLNRNFTNRYKDHEPGTGPYQISEPESKALIDFFLRHPHITMAVFYGRHDNLAQAPPSAKKGGPKKEEPKPGGRRRFSRPKPPVGLHKDDVALYKQISKDYRKLTTIKKAPTESTDGAAFAWAYAEYGIPAFACRVWTRPEPKKPEKAQEGAGQSTEPGTGTPDNAGEPTPSTSENPDQATAEQRGEGKTKRKRKGQNGKGKGKRGEGMREKKEEKSPNAEAIAWLKYSDEKRDGAGFIPWSPFDHPQLGEVEIGGFVPFFRTTPPAEALDTLAERQLRFVEYLARRFPKPTLEPVVVTKLSDSIFEIRTALVNDGYFPTGLAIAKLNRRVRPIVIVLDVPLQRILGGTRVAKIWSVPGSGGRHELRWVIRGDLDATVKIKLTSEKYGNQTIDVELAPNG